MAEAKLVAVALNEPLGVTHIGVVIGFGERFGLGGCFRLFGFGRSNEVGLRKDAHFLRWYLFFFKKLPLAEEFAGVLVQLGGDLFGQAARGPHDAVADVGNEGLSGINAAC
jgi:hypothetical protein